MLSLKNLILVAPILLSLTSAYTLTACTDTACSENCQVFDAPDTDEDGPCLDFGFTVMSLIYGDTSESSFVLSSTGAIVLTLQYRRTTGFVGPGARRMS